MSPLVRRKIGDFLTGREPWTSGRWTVDPEGTRGCPWSILAMDTGVDRVDKVTWGWGWGSTAYTMVDMSGQRESTVCNVVDNVDSQTWHLREVRPGNCGGQGGQGGFPVGSKSIHVTMLTNMGRGGQNVAICNAMGLWWHNCSVPI
ncbi:hypothetical protein B0H11DRAFT_1934172 [Mycena galericulata]|nr:hypothetical protein B0H11DRAFT_1934172 [Mycena galericulata]